MCVMRTAVLLVFAVATTSARAEDAAASRDWEVRAGVGGYVDSQFLDPSNLFAGATLSRRVASSVSLEVSLGRGFGNQRKTGLQLGGAIRLWAPGDVGRTHGLSGAAGLWHAQGDAYGGVSFAVAELAYSVRFRPGLVLLAGAGAAVVLTDSRTPSAGPWVPIPKPFRAGEVGPWFRVEAGWAF
jgi:hypothetical protein